MMIFKRFCLLALFSLLPVVAAAQGVQLQNPVQAYPTIAKFIEGTLQAIVYIALPVIGFFIVYSGFLFISARGNESQIKKARENFVAVIIGAALILGAWVLATLIAGTVSQLVSG